MKERIRQLRKTLGLNQADFGAKVGVKGNTIGNYELGLRNPSDLVILSICREFGVNEIWLRTGEGGDENMFTQINDEDRFTINLAKLSNTENQFIQNAINTFAESSPEKLKIIEQFFKDCLGIK